MAVDKAIIRPAFLANTPCYLVYVSRLGRIAQVQAAVPHVILAESPNDAITRLIDAHREISIAYQQTFLRLEHGLIYCNLVQGFLALAMAN